MNPKSTPPQTPESLPWRNLVRRLLTDYLESESTHTLDQSTDPQTLQPEDQCIVIPGFRRDGVGIQALMRIVTMSLCRHSGSTYVHKPFLDVSHQETDSKGRYESKTEWASNWETFFNLGQDERPLVHVANVVDRERLIDFLSIRSEECLQLGLETTIGTSDFLRMVFNRELVGVHTAGLGICRTPNQGRLSLDTEFARVLRQRFLAGGYSPRAALYTGQYTDVALHIRRGDTWFGHGQTPTTAAHRTRAVAEEYYANLIRQLHPALSQLGRPIRYHMFTDGNPEDFAQFTFIDDARCEAVLKCTSQPDIENICFHMSVGAMDTLFHLIEAPVLVPGRSAFSVVAALLSDSYVLVGDTVKGFYQYAFMSEYMTNSRKFVHLGDPESDAIQALKVLMQQAL